MKRKTWVKKLLFGGFILLLIGAGVIWYIFSEKHEDTASVKSDYTTEAIPFIKEFEKDIKEANRKYAEKIIEVTGVITESEAADTTINIKMADIATGSYLIFAFQQQYLQQAKTLKPGDKATIKGSCSDGIFSEILGTYFISFKRSTLLK
jgi:tRNA_anti-like